MPRAHYAAEMFIKNHPDGLLKPILRIQLEFGRLTNMSVAARAKSGQLALQATLSGLTHAKCSQDRSRVLCLSHGFTGHCQGMLAFRSRGHTYLGEMAKLKLNPQIVGKLSDRKRP